MPEPILNNGERLIGSFTGNRGTYIREHVMLAAIGSVGMSGALLYAGNPHAWTGVVGAVLAIAVRGFYVASEQLGLTWHLTNHRLIGPDGHTIPLGDVAKARPVLSAVQVITRSGDKYMLKYQASTAATTSAINEALR